MRSKVLITGAEGFIGSHLVENLLREGYDVRATCMYTFDSKLGWLDTLPPNIMRNIEVMLGDIRDPYFVREAAKGVSKIFHLGALIGIPYSYVAPNSYLDTNISGTLNVLEAAKQFSVEKTLITSTSEVYGTAQYVPMDEKHPLSAQSPYSASKIAADALATSYFLSFNLPVTIIRPFNTYGPRQSQRAIIPSLIAQFLDKNKKELSVGNLETTRDFNFVHDTVRAFVLAADSEFSSVGPYNIATGTEVSVQEVITNLAIITGRNLQINIEESRVRPSKSEVYQLLGDNSLAQKELSWHPETSFKDGLRKTVEWFSKNRNFYNVSDRYHI